MKKIIVVTGLTLLMASPLTMAAGNAKKIADGKFLFEDWGCTACHGIGPSVKATGDSGGPDLHKLFNRRKADWVKKFVKDPQGMIDSGDKDAVEMHKQYGKVMKKFKISDSEWDSIFEYIKSVK